MAPSDKGKFAKLIRETRESHGWTQDDLADESGVSRSTIARWEGGDARAPKPEQLRAVCLTLGIDLREAVVALGYLTPEDIAPSTEPRPQLDPTLEEVVAILQDPGVPTAEKDQWIDYLRFLRQRQRPGQTSRRNVG